jgi:DNA-binding CsgD family transcriptional regulator
MLHDSEIPAAKSRYYAWITAGKQSVEEPLWRGFPAVGPAIVRRDQVVSDRDWYKSHMFNEIFRPDGVDGFVLSCCPLPGGLQDFLAAQARPGRRLGRHEMRMVYLLHREIAPLIGRALAGSWEPGLDALSRRMRQTLDALLEGDSEKQVALRLGISCETVHVYVKKLYQHFGVASRPELMAHFLRRYRRRRALIEGADPTGLSVVS